MICSYEGCQLVLNGRFGMYRGEHYCEPHLKNAQSESLAAPAARRVPAASAGTNCSRCSAAVTGGVESVFSTRTQGELDINVSLCPSCTNEWADLTSQVIYNEMKEFLCSHVAVEIEEPKPGLTELLPEPLESLAPRPGEDIVVIADTVNPDTVNLDASDPD